MRLYKTNTNSYKIALLCREYRLSLGYTQQHIANIVNCSKENICAFEHGRNSNILILLAYGKIGLDLNKLVGII